MVAADARRRLHERPQRAEVFNRMPLVQALRIRPPPLRPSPSPQDPAKHIDGVRVDLAEIHRKGEHS
jgi:hypothetical protein